MNVKQEDNLAEVLKIGDKNGHMINSLSFLQELSQQPNILNFHHIEELSELLDKFDNKQLTDPYYIDRMQAFLKIKFNRNVFTPEDRAKLHMMRDIWFNKPKLNDDQLLTYMILEEYFGILDRLDTNEMEKLKYLLITRVTQGLSPEQEKMLDLLEKKLKLCNITR